MDWRRTVAEPSDEALIEQGRQVLRAEGEAILASADSLAAPFCQAVRLLQQCTGSVVVTGMGKAGLIGRKLSATLASTGTPSHFLHPAEAMHGDLGALRRDDLVLAISQSGETAELTQILPHVDARSIPLIALTGRADSTLGRAAAVVVATGKLVEADSLGVAPSTSTTVMLALGDSMALVVSRLRGFSHSDFAARHPGGSLGMRLLKVEQAMRPLERCRTAAADETVRQVFARPLPTRRTGAVMIVAADGRLTGIFTDSDLARLFEHRHDDALDRPIGEVMTCQPNTARLGSRLEEAIGLLESRRLSELPVIDEAGRPHGLLDIVDLVGVDLSAVETNPEGQPSARTAA
jgi:arabinose-5-phosphate isomerase